MTTPSGQIGMSDVNTEFNRSASTQVSFNDTDVRNLAGKAGSGTTISMNDMRNKTTLSASVFLTSVSGYIAALNTAGATSISTITNPSVNVTGGTGPFSYQWLYVSGTALSIGSDTSAISSFYTTLSPGDSVSGVYRCRVTDGASGQIVYTNNVTITLTYYALWEGNLATSYIASTISPTTATSRIEVRRDGYFWRITNGTTSQLSAWVTPNHSTVGDLFNMKWENWDSASSDNSSASAVTPAVSTVSTINGTKYFERNRTTVGTYTAGFTLYIGSAYHGTFPFVDNSYVRATMSSSTPPPPPLPSWSPPTQIP